jgi:hypothetical protein
MVLVKTRSRRTSRLKYTKPYFGDGAASFSDQSPTGIPGDCAEPGRSEVTTGRTSTPKFAGQAVYRSGVISRVSQDFT